MPSQSFRFASLRIVGVIVRLVPLPGQLLWLGDRAGLHNVFYWNLVPLLRPELGGTANARYSSCRAPLAEPLLAAMALTPWP
jgi:hypothetical protein